MTKAFSLNKAILLFSLSIGGVHIIDARSTLFEDALCATQSTTPPKYTRNAHGQPTAQRVSYHNQLPHKAKAAVSSSPQLVSTTKKGDPLLDGPPTGWDARVLGVGTGAGQASSTAAEAQKPTNTPSQNEKELNTQTLQQNAHLNQNQIADGEGRNNAVTSSNLSVADQHSKNRILIPIPSRMGIAGYQTGDRFIIAIDSTHPTDLATLHGDGIFANMSVTSFSGITLISLPTPDTRRLYLSQQMDGWVLGDHPPPGDDYSDRREINPSISTEGLLFPMRRAGRVFTIKDPVSGAHLIIGTTTLDDGGILSLRKGKEYDVWPSLEGVVIADHQPAQVEMKVTPQGDLLSINGGKPLSDLEKSVYASDVDLDWLGLQHLSMIDAQKRYKKAILAAADSIPKERFSKRYEAAKSALGAGAFPDARAIMQVALEDDPEEAFRPDVRFFLSAVDLLTNHVQGAEPLAQDWPNQETRATKLWQGLYFAAIGTHNKDAAHLLARDIDRLLNYPKALRDVLLPQAAEQIARYGTPEDRHVLNKMPQESPYQLAQAIRDLRNGAGEEATPLLQRLSVDRDPIVAEKAMEEGITLSLKEGHLTPQQAAQQYASLLPDAMLGGREGTLNTLRAIADIKGKNWEKALIALDQAAGTPKGHNDARLPALYNLALNGVAHDATDLPASANIPNTERLRLTALLRAHIPSLPDTAQKADLLVAYGRSLDRLGLPEQATEAFAEAIPMILDPVRKAEVGDELANNQINRGLYDDASKTLATTANTPMLPVEASRRNRMIAKMTADSGKDEVALYLLNSDNDPESADLRAKIHEKREEWSPAVTDLKNVASAYLPEHGNLSIQQQLLALRLASDASRANDAGALSWIRERVGNRPFEGEAGQMFHLLVSPNEEH